MDINKRKIFKFILLIILVIFCICSFIFLYKHNKKNVVMERKIESILDFGNAIVSNNNGYVIVGSNNKNNSSFEKAKISYYDSNNQKYLEKVYNKGYNSTFFDVIGDEDSYVAVGSFESNKREQKNSSRTALIVKYDKSGNVVFENDFQVISNSGYNSIISMVDGYVVCGYSINTETDEANSGAVLIKYDKSGEEIWRRYTGNDHAVYNNLIYHDGFIYAVGVDNNIGILSIFDVDGNLMRDTYYHNMDDDGFSSIIADDNYLYVSGGKIVDNNKYAFIATYDFNGNFIDEVVYNKENTRYTNMNFDNNGNIIVIGSLNTLEEDNTYNENGIIGKYNTELKELSVIKYNSDKQVTFNDILINNNKYSVLSNVYNDLKNVNNKLLYFSTSLKTLGG